MSARLRITLCHRKPPPQVSPKHPAFLDQIVSAAVTNCMAPQHTAQDVSQGRPEPSPAQTGHCLVLVDMATGTFSYTGDAEAMALVPPGASATVFPLAQLPPQIHDLIGHSQALKDHRVSWPQGNGSTMSALADLAMLPAPGAQTRLCALLLRQEVAPDTGVRLPLDFVLFSAMAHEIKNSLVAIKTLSELLLEKNPAQEMARIVRQEVDRIATIVGQMLSASAPTENRSGEIQLHSILRDIEKILRPLAEAKSIGLTLNLEAARDRIHADSRQIEQAILNVAMNGLEAIGQNGQLTIRTANGGNSPTAQREGTPLRRGSIIIAVQDTGTGISPEAARRLYEDFFTTKSRGSGLGLSITRRVMESYGGTIAANSQPGQGTCFELTFPLPEISQ